uniref:Family with sequence similarity 98 member B n=1 Tax=Oryzias melastigma TaxID=30732 RepID=A0A3B3C2U7_ORYME
MECDILDSLDQLGYDGPLLEEKALLRAADSGLSSPDYVNLCSWLASRLKPLCNLEESITSGSDDMESLQVEMSGLLRELHCPYEDAPSGVPQGAVGNTKKHLQFLCTHSPSLIQIVTVCGAVENFNPCSLSVFLSSELQAAQIVSCRRACHEQQSRSPVYQELSAVCEALQLPEPRGREAPEVLSAVQNKVSLVFNPLLV